MIVRHDQRRHEVALGPVAAGEAAAAQPVGRQAAQHQRGDGGQHRHDRRGPHRIHPARIAEEGLVPAQREAGRRKGERPRRRERHRDHDQERHGQEHQAEDAGGREQAAAPGLCCRHRVDGLAVEPAVAGEDQQGHDQQDGRDRRGLLPARDLVDQRVEQVGDHRHAPAAQHRRRDVEAEAQDEDQQRAGRQRRQGQREIDLPEDRARRRAQRCRRLQQPVVDADHGGEQRQHQERQQHVGHADGDAELVVEELRPARR